MVSRFKQKAVIVILCLAFTMLFGAFFETNAQTYTRYYLQLCIDNAELGNYYGHLCMLEKKFGISDTNGYCSTQMTYMQNAYSYAYTAAQYAYQDYNNGTSSQYYLAYYEYVILNNIQTALNNSVSYATASASATDAATVFQNRLAATSYGYSARSQFGPALFFAGCE